MRCFKRPLGVLIILFIGISITQVRAYPHLLLKDLFNVLKVDHIGFGHALLHSKWIENMYQYGKGKPHRQLPGDGQSWSAGWSDDPIANLVRHLWFRRNENDSLEPTRQPSDLFDPINAKLFGTLINLTYKLAELEQAKWEKKKIDAYGVIQKDIKRINLNKLLGRLNEIRKKEGKKLSSEQVSQREGALKAFEEMKERFEKENSRVKRAIGEIVQKYKILTKNVEKAKLGEFNKAKKDEIAAVQASSQAEQLHEVAVLALARYVRDLAKTVEDVKKIEGIEQNVEKRRKLREKLKGMEPPSKETVKESAKKVRVLSAQVQKMRKQVGGLDFLVKHIEAGLQTYQQAIYLPGTVEGILWAFFFHKIDKLPSLEAKVQAINTCLKSINDIYKNKVTLGRMYNAEQMDTFEEKLALRDDTGVSPQDLQLDKIFKKYDLALHFFIAKLAGSFPPKVSQGSNMYYEYAQGEFSRIGVPDCFETTMNDMFSILWYNRQIEGYDNDLFSKSILENGQGFKRLREALKYFYLANKYQIPETDYTVNGITSLLTLESLGKITPEQIRKLSVSDIPPSLMCSSAMKQAFFNLISGHPEIISYDKSVGRQKVFELTPGVGNFVNICNYFYGTKAENVEDLGKEDGGLSIPSREIKFKSNGDTEINITVHNKRYGDAYSMRVDINPGAHATLTVPGRDVAGLDVLEKGFTKGLARNLSNLQRVTIFTLLTSPKLLKDETFTWSVSLLHLIYYSLVVKGAKVKLAIIEDVFKRGHENYERWKGMVHNLIDALPEDRYYKKELARIIIRWGFYHYAKDPFFVQYVDSVINDPEMYAGGWRGFGLPNVFKAALVQGNIIREGKKEGLAQIYDQLALRIMNHPKFTYALHAMKIALKQKRKDIAETCLNHSSFNANSDHVGPVINRALENAQDLLKTGDKKGAQAYKDLLWRVINHGTFGPSRKGVIEFMVLALMDPGFKEFGEKVMEVLPDYSFGEAVIFALGKGYIDIAARLARDQRFKVDRYGARHLISAAIEKMAAFRNSKDLASEKAYKEFLVGIIKKPTFDAGGDYIGKVLDEKVLKEAYKDVVLAILENPLFDKWKNTLIGALKHGHKDIAMILLNHPRFNYHRGVRFGLDGALKKAIKMGNQDIAQALINHPNFKLYSTGDSLVAALGNGYADIIEKLMVNPAFDINRRGNIEFMVFALKKPGFEKFGLEMINNPRFSIDSWGKALGEALKHKYPDVAMMLIQNPKFNASGSNMVLSGLQAAIKKGYKDVVLEVMKHPTFYQNKYLAGVISMALKKEQELLGREDAEDKEGAKDYKDIALRIAQNENFDASKGTDKYRFAYPTDSMNALIRALYMNHPDIALALVRNETFNGGVRGAPSALKKALQKGYVEVAELLAKNPAFIASEYAGEGLKNLLTMKQIPDIALDFVEIPLIILNNPAFYGQHVGEALKGIVEAGYPDIALRIVENEKFNATRNKVVEALKLALEKGYKNIVEKIVAHPSFTISQKGVGEFVVLALSNPEFAEIGRKIFYDPAFGWQEALGFALDKEDRDIILMILESDIFDASKAGIIDFAKKALEKGYLDIVARIIEDEKFNMGQLEVIDILSNLIEEGNKKIIFMTVENEKFNPNTYRIISILNKALEKEYLDIALAIVNNKNFNAGIPGIINILKKALGKGYRDIALAIANNEKFGARELGNALKLALDNRARSVALAIVNNKNFSANFKGVGDVLKLALGDRSVLKTKEKIKPMDEQEEEEGVLVGPGYSNVALGIVKNHAFDAGKPWVIDVLDMAKKFVITKPERKKQLQEVIDAITQKKTEKLELFKPKSKLKHKTVPEVPARRTFRTRARKPRLELVSRLGRAKGIEVERIRKYQERRRQEEMRFSALFTEFKGIVEGGDNKDLNNFMKENESFFDNSKYTKKIVEFLIEKDRIDLIFKHPSKILLEKAIESLFEKFGLDFVEKLIQDPEFKYWGLLFYGAIKKDHTDLALELINNPRFTFGDVLKSDIIWKVLSKVYELRKNKDETGAKIYEKIALKVINHPEFDAWTNALEHTIKHGSKDLVYKVYYHPRFVTFYMGNKYIVKSILKYAKEKGYDDIIWSVVSHPEFTLDKEWITEILGSVEEFLEKTPKPARLPIWLRKKPERVAPAVPERKKLTKRELEAEPGTVFWAIVRKMTPKGRPLVKSEFGVTVCEVPEALVGKIGKGDVISAKKLPIGARIIRMLKKAGKRAKKYPQL